jgi:hypothetical protein
LTSGSGAPAAIPAPAITSRGTIRMIGHVRRRV